MYNLKFLRIFIFIIFCYIPVATQSQDFRSTQKYREFNKANGFDADGIWAFHQDSLGFMWVGTDNGLYRFDGKESKRILKSVQINDSTEVQLEISAIYEDQHGILWLGVKSNPAVGLLKFDPRTSQLNPFNIYPDSIHIGKKWISNIYQDDNNILWLTTDVGFILFDMKNESPSAIIHPKEPEMSFLRKYDIKPEVLFEFSEVLPNPSGEDIWLTTSYGLFLFDADDNSFQSFLPDQVQIHDSHIVTYATFDTFGMLWVTFSGWLYRFDPKTREFEPVYKELEDYAMGSTFRTWVLFNPKNDKQLVLAGGSKGTMIVNIENFKYQMILDKMDPEKSLNGIARASFDSSGNLWLGTESEGITIVPKLNTPFHAIWDLSDRNIFDTVGYMLRSIDISANNKLWIGGGYFLHAFDLDRKILGPEKYLRIPECFKDEFGNDGIHYLRCDPNGEELWISSFGACFQKYNPQTGDYLLINPYPQGIPLPIEGLEWDSLGYVWGGGYIGIVRIDPKTGQYVHFELDSIFLKHKGKIGDVELSEDGLILSLLKTSNGEILFQSRNNIFALEIIEDSNPEDVYIEKYRFHEVIPSYLLEDLIGNGNDYLGKSMVDNFDHIWFGTEKSGLFHYDPEKKWITNYTTEDGLARNRINTSIMDHQNRIWIGCWDGLSCLIPETGEIYNFFESDGLVSSSFRVNRYTYQGHSQIDKDGNIYMGTNRGVIYFNPDEVINSIQKPSMVISSLIINNEQIKPKENGIISQSISYFPDIHLKHTDKQVSVQYSIPDFTKNYDRIRYQHKLEGFDDRWIDEGEMTRLTYSNIPAGNYQLKINASNTGYFIEENAISLNIHMAPPPWATWWAYVLYVLFIITTGYLLANSIITRNRIKRKHELEHIELEKVKELEEAKTRFFTQISHEIRTPLSLILQPVESLYKGEAKGGESKFYSIIRRNALRLNELLDQILEFSKLKSGQVKLKIDKQDIVTFTRFIISNFQSFADSHGIRLTLESPQLEIQSIYFDPDKIEKVMNNLLSNAIKFVPKGGQIVVRIEKKGRNEAFATKKQRKDEFNILQGKDVVVISISDTGIGIPEEEQEKVFDRYYRGQEENQYEGIGIGLSLTKELIDLHKGAIWVESEVGKGSTFYVALPLGKSHFSEDDILKSDKIDKINSNISLEDDASDSAFETDKQTVLFIEDNEDMREYVKYFFENDCDYQEAIDGQEGFTKAIDFIPDIIISDVMMPKMDGLELCKRLKDDRRTRHIPIILLTAKADKESKFTGLGVGAEDYISKPFDSQELILKVQNQLDQMDRLRSKFIQEFLLMDRKEKVKSRDDVFLSDLAVVIMNNLDDSEFSVEVLSHEIGLSRSQLFRKLKALTGQGPNDFIRTIRIKKAAELLLKNIGNVSEIAYSVGFDNLSYFSKCFASIYHVSPSDYSESMHKRKS